MGITTIHLRFLWRRLIKNGFDKTQRRTANGFIKNGCDKIQRELETCRAHAEGEAKQRTHLGSSCVDARTRVEETFNIGEVVHFTYA